MKMVLAKIPHFHGYEASVATEVDPRMLQEICLCKTSLFAHGAIRSSGYYTTTAIIDADPLSMIDGGLNGNSNIASDMTSENNNKKSTRVKRRVSWFFF